MPWAGENPPFGFSPDDGSDAPWLPQPADWRELTVEGQTGDERSMLELYRRALSLRRSHPALGDGTLSWLDAPVGALAFARDPGFVCIVNLSGDPVAVPDGAELLISSGPLTDDGRLPFDTSVWLTTRARDSSARGLSGRRAAPGPPPAGPP